MLSRFSVLALLGVTASAYTIPSNLATIYANHKAGSCSDKLGQTGFNNGDTSVGDNFGYCGDLSGSIFLHSSGDGGRYADMDIDCDGANLGSGDCANDPSGQDTTAFMDTVGGYGKGISDLDANVHSYVVFGNFDSSPSFDPESFGMKPLSVMAIVCNNQLHYGVWGDTNGGTSVGEASLALGKLCFPDDGLTGDNGHDENDVLYIGFTGSSASTVPGANGATWDTEDPATFEASLKTMGDKLVAQLA